MDAKTRRKMRRQTERDLKAEGIDTDTYWYSMGPVKKEKEPELIPGKDFYKETEEAQAKIDNNRWDNNLDEVVSFIKWATRPNSEIFDEKGQYKAGETAWSWAKNWDCKYVNICIDMRDGGFVLIDQRGKRVSLDAIKWQYKFEDKNV